MLPAGRCALEWDGRGDDGASLRSGIYFYRGTRDGAVAGRGRVIKTGP